VSASSQEGGEETSTITEARGIEFMNSEVWNQALFKSGRGGGKEREKVVARKERHKVLHVVLECCMMLSLADSLIQHFSLTILLFFCFFLKVGFIYIYED